MAMIFPGMDPYLEYPRIWPGVHSRLIVYLADRLQPALGDRYIAAVEERVYVEGPGPEVEAGREIIPDVWLRARRTDGGRAVAVLEADAPVLIEASMLEVHESYIAILDRQTGQEVVTVIEVVSPSNKYAGPGRESYVQKQAQVRGSRAHLVEIDLLRAGPHALAIDEKAARDLGHYDSLVCVNRAWRRRDRFELYPRNLRDRLPRARIPLADGDPDVALDLPAGLAQTYDAGRYRDRLDYAHPCLPALSPVDQAWADDRIREAIRPGA